MLKNSTLGTWRFNDYRLKKEDLRRMTEALAGNSKAGQVRTREVGGWGDR